MADEANNQNGEAKSGAGDAQGTLLGGAAAQGGGAADAGAKGGDPSLLGGAGDSGKADGADKGAADQKPEEKKVGAPESYAEFKAPEGVTLDKAALDKALPVFKELNLSQEQAQKLVDLQAASVAESTKAFAEQAEKWKAEVQAIPDHQKVLGDAVLALNKLADPDTAALIKGSWLGSHPGVIKLLAGAGKLLREDPLHEGKAGGGGGPRDAADALFGDMFTK